MLALIAAMDRRRGIGFNGGMPWHIPGELRRFRELTLGSALIMGRRTFESLKGALPDRINIVLTSQADYQAEDCLIAHRLEDAIAMAAERSENIYIGGGAQIYLQSLPLVEKMYITEIDAEFEADTHFPAFDESQFTREIIARHDDAIPYTYLSYTRK